MVGSSRESPVGFFSEQHQIQSFLLSPNVSSAATKLESPHCVQFKGTTTKHFRMMSPSKPQTAGHESRIMHASEIVKEQKAEEELEPPMNVEKTE